MCGERKEKFSLGASKLININTKLININYISSLFNIVKFYP